MCDGLPREWEVRAPACPGGGGSVRQPAWGLGGCVPAYPGMRGCVPACSGRVNKFRTQTYMAEIKHISLNSNIIHSKFRLDFFK